MDADADFLIPVLIDIADTAHRLSTSFQHLSKTRQSCLSITTCVDSEEAFQSLRQKYGILILYYSEVRTRAVSQTQSDLCRAFPGSMDSLSNMASPGTTARSIEKGCRCTSYQTWTEEPCVLSAPQFLDSMHPDVVRTGDQKGSVP